VAKQSRTSKFERVMRMLENRGLGVAYGGPYYHGRGSLWARIEEKVGKDSKRFVDERVESPEFRRRIATMFYETSRMGLDAASQSQIVDILIGQASSLNLPEHDLHLRVGGHDGDIYLDICDATRSVVAIRPGGWRVESNHKCPVRFWRSPSMRPLPRSEKGGNLDELRELLNVGRDGDWILIVAHLLDALWPRGPHAVLVVTGEQGSGKSTACTMLRQLTDPSATPSRRLPKNADDGNISAVNSRILCFDNVSLIQDWQSDFLCRLSTGSADATRLLYRQDTEKLYASKNPIILNSVVTNVVRRPDLYDRTFAVHLPPIPDDRRRIESAVWDKFDQARGRILGALLDAVATALERERSVEIARLPRLTDLARFLTAAEPALGWREGTFVDAMLSARSRGSRDLVEADPVGRAVLTMMGFDEREAIEAEPEEMRRRLLAYEPDLPETSQVLRADLDRLAPELRRVGIEFVAGTLGRGGSKRRSWTFRRVAADRVLRAVAPESDQVVGGG
jgi:putative DNA primase/helicase